MSKPTRNGDMCLTSFTQSSLFLCRQVGAVGIPFERAVPRAAEPGGARCERVDEQIGREWIE